VPDGSDSATPASAAMTDYVYTDQSQVVYSKPEWVATEGQGMIHHNNGEYDCDIYDDGVSLNFSPLLFHVVAILRAWLQEL
jgi:hypothetical protein